MKPYIKIADQIYRGIWAIRLESLYSIKSQFENHLKQGAKLPMDDEMMPSEDNEEDDDIINGTQIISVEGIIGKHLSMMETMCGGTDTENITQQLLMAKKNPNCKNILLNIKSPGGTVSGVAALAELISEIDTEKPVYAYTDTQAASAAYWLGSQARAFFAEPSADVGSVGVYSLLYDESRALDREGIVINPIVSKGSPMKLAGAPFKKLEDIERAYFQASVDKIYDQFSRAVKSKRDISDEYLDGRVYDGEDAVKYNLIDGVANSIDDVLTLINKQ